MLAETGAEFALPYLAYALAHHPDLPQASGGLHASRVWWGRGQCHGGGTEPRMGGLCVGGGAYVQVTPAALP